ncbi:MAG: YkvA family protein [Leptolyngbya sp. IPPAS B-1204]|uniref:DUF1232 domain-containing protein n=1 Tax=Leptolyngbya sp. NK1-12 TaxID=2547451 RepID=A0AA96WLB7_9CYAN|nr:YkvA family protein [Leptolyngbya sp. NK1-12]MBF2049385.1 DUF1232 domain-containing protein [Elainella sp. C42_A2020_010]RNJ68447.1 MAG: DUF1232 domain-containing protein [Leptolyngbya sp. IPPAS B-1204]WNZ24351.1 DUF1232 domain-containing protein [Leptolyngbya sp. NK1-12]
MVNPTEPSETGYSEPDFWRKLNQFAILAGRNVVEKALTLYYAAQRPETPLWAKMVIYSSLAYFVLPTDALPDFMPFVGYTDDLGTIASALVTVAMSITPEVKATARQQVQAWFGDETVSSEHPQSGDTMREIPIE